MCRAAVSSRRTWPGRAPAPRRARRSRPSRRCSARAWVADRFWLIRSTQRWPSCATAKVWLLLPRSVRARSASAGMPHLASSPVTASGPATTTKVSFRPNARASVSAGTCGAFAFSSSAPAKTPCRLPELSPTRYRLLPSLGWPPWRSPGTLPSPPDHGQLSACFSHALRIPAMMSTSVRMGVQGSSCGAVAVIVWWSGCPAWSRWWAWSAWRARYSALAKQV